MTGPRARSSTIAWLIVLVLLVVAAVGYGLWLDATTGPLCRAEAHAPGLATSALLVAIVALLAAAAGATLGLRRRAIVAQVGVAFALSAVVVVAEAFAFVGEHHCFD
jgi:hypothetical protein